MRYTRTLLKLCTFALIGLGNTGLSQPTAQARFEVASVRPSRPGVGPRDARILANGDRFDAEASTVGDILDMLNGWQLLRVVGGPAWLRTDRYDIHGVADAPIAPGQRQAAIMALLAERFNLAVHHETRDMPSVVLLPPRIPPC